jgi:hypothetical protein
VYIAYTATDASQLDKIDEFATMYENVRPYAEDHDLMGRNIVFVATTPL